MELPERYKGGLYFGVFQEHDGAYYVSVNDTPKGFMKDTHARETRGDRLVRSFLGVNMDFFDVLHPFITNAGPHKDLRKEDILLERLLENNKL